MNRPSLSHFPGPLRRAGLPLLAALLILSPAHAAPRTGTHEGYTRVVFDLPAATPAAQPDIQVAAQSVTVKLGVKLPAEQGKLSAPGVSAYAVSGGTVTVMLAPGHTKARASVWPAAGGAPARLVIDVPTSQVAQASVKAASPAPGAAVTRPTSARTPTRPRVLLDAGHGGIDPGMVSQWVREKEVTLDVALRTRAELVRHGVDVVMVRETDRHLSPDKKTDLRARAGLASSGEISAYVSIHVNAAAAGAQGIETFYFGQPLDPLKRSLAVAENGGGSTGEELTKKAAGAAQNLLGDLLAQAKLAFSRQLAQKVQSRLVQYTGAVNRGVHTNVFYVIQNPTTPAILVELGFGSSPVEGPRLAQDAYREKLAQGLARAILDFLNMK